MQKAHEKQLQEEERQKWLAAEQHKIQQESRKLLLTTVAFPSTLEINRLTPARQIDWSGSHQFKKGTCRLCGTKTRDWFFFDNVTHICECNACLGKKGKTVELGDV